MLSVLLLSFAVFVIAFINLSNVVSKEKSLFWGLLTLFIPPISIVFSVVYWTKLRLSVVISLLGIAVFTTAMFFGGYEVVLKKVDEKGLIAEANKLIFGYEYKSPVIKVEKTKSIDGKTVKLPGEKIQVAESDSGSQISTETNLKIEEKVQDKSQADLAQTDKNISAKKKKTKKEFILVKSYKKVDLRNSSKYVGSNIIISYKSGKKSEGILKRANRDSIVFEKRTGSGYANFPVPFDRIVKLKVEHLEKRSV